MKVITNSVLELYSRTLSIQQQVQPLEVEKELCVTENPIKLCICPQLC